MCLYSTHIIILKGSWSSLIQLNKSSCVKYKWNVYISFREDIASGGREEKDETAENEPAGDAVNAEAANLYAQMFKAELKKHLNHVIGQK